MKNERTSKRVSTIAARVLDSLKNVKDGENVNIYVQDWIFPKWKGMTFPMTVRTPLRKITVADLKALAASCLTQSPDVSKKGRKK